MIIPVNTRPPYKIFISPWNVSHTIFHIKKYVPDNQLFIITNTTVANLYRRKLDLLFKRHFKTLWITIPDGERHKNLATCEKILVQLSKLGANRSSCLLALGGGVVGDITGFVASTYMRGIRYFQMPTTLLAQVDASIGGKTGVDLPTGKNLVGTFYQPSAVFIHTNFLKTLPDREFRCGLAEIIKYALIRDQKFWGFLQDNVTKIRQRNAHVTTKMITTCCKIKAQIVTADEREQGQRMILNLGHTLGHAIEVLSRFKRWSHGEAVAMGLVFAARLSHQLGVSKKNLTPEIKALLRTFGLPTDCPRFSRGMFKKALRTDKKSNRFILIKKIGKVIAAPVETRLIASLHLKK